MKNTIKATTLAMTALMAASVSAPTFAAQTATTGTPSVGHSTAKVALKAGDSTQPTGPTDPTDPGDGSNPGTGNTGDLTLDFVSNLDFGEHELTGAAQTFTPETINGKASTDLNHADTQVTDKRGSGAGWALSVKYGKDDSSTDSASNGATAGQEWTNTTTAGQYLDGANLELPAATWVQGADKATTGAPSVLTGVTVNDDDQDIATAATNEGMGTWVGQMASDAVKLSIPQTAKVGSYTANLVWTLTDAAK